jgi:hypothetical protein
VSSKRTASLLAWSMCALSLALTALSLLLLALIMPYPGVPIFAHWLDGTLLAINFSTVGAVIASRSLPNNPIGWLFCTTGLVDSYPPQDPRRHLLHRQKRLRLAPVTPLEIVQHPPKITPQEVMREWAEEWAKEGVAIDWEKLLPPKGFRVLPRRWVVERTFSWVGQNRRMSKDYERLPGTSEAFIYVGMMRLMVRRLARV